VIPLESLAVIAASYLVFMLLGYTTAKHIQRHMLKEVLLSASVATHLYLPFSFASNLAQ